MTFTQVKFKLTPALLQRTLVIVEYDELPDAAEHVSEILEWKPIGLEALDLRLIENQTGHMAEEARGAIADLRAHAEKALREELGTRWVTFRREHAGLRGLEIEDRDPSQYLQEHGD